MEYRLYFLGRRGLIDGPSAGFEAEDDKTALAMAWEMYRTVQLSEGGFELWQGARCAHTEKGE